MNLAVSGQSVRPRSMRRRGVRRRGIILLLSLTLLTLFLMMLVTLIVITGQYRQSARVQARQDRVGDPPYRLTDTALRTIMVGDGAGMSAATGHELLRDVYGGSWRGVVTSDQPTNIYTTGAADPLRLNPGSTGAFITFNFRRRNPAGGFENLYLNSSPGDFTNCILTFVSGSGAKNVSVRILEYVPPPTNSDPADVGRFTIARSTLDDRQGLYDSTTLADAIAEGDEFVVNERPFSGYGAGYAEEVAPRTGYNIATIWPQPYGPDPPPPLPAMPPSAPLPAALLPNYRLFDPTLATMGAGGMNEDYDALDYQNMFLASVPPGATRADQIVPSFWRPELINYWRHFTFDHDNDPGTTEISLWYQSDSGTPGPATGYVAQRRNAFYRLISLRPLPTDHPEFTGSNADAALPVVAGVSDVRMPLSAMLTGSNDIDENATFIPATPPAVGLVYDTGADDDGSSGTTPWPPVPGTTVTDPIRDLNDNGIHDQWDVDNDNDGITDSIWIDIGLPAQRLEDGKLYKPLVAFLIRDLDGLANVNAHLHADFVAAAPSTLTGPLAGPAGPSSERPRGLGYGPAEIGFPGALFDNYQTGALLAARYGGTGIDERAGRVGVNDPLSHIRNPSLPKFPYLAAGAQATEWGTPPDAWGTQAIALDYRGQPWNNRVDGSMTPPQLRTHMENVLPTPPPPIPPDPPSPFVAPFTAVMHPNGPTEGGDDPYEIDLYSAHAAAADLTLNYRTPDAPFTLAELERVLRWNDPDVAYLPGRLVSTINPANDTTPDYAFNDPGRRRSVTTHSSHIPAAPAAIPSERRAGTVTEADYLGTGEKRTLYHLFAMKLIADARQSAGAPFDGTGFPGFPGSSSQPWNELNHNHRNWVDNQIRAMMPWEVWHGMKFDLNRRWQNGFDDDNDGTVDEPDEVAIETVFPDETWTSNYDLDDFARYDQAFDHLGADPLFTAAGQRQYARQIYARHLYCTALVLMDYDKSGANGFRPGAMFDPQDYDPTTFDPTNGTDDPLDPFDHVDKADELFKRQLAQWAINVVDYRDSDAICTPFEYDLNPFDGWQADIDGDPATPIAGASWGQRRIVWGVEAPHLLISETLALHNRRVVDSARDTNTETREDGDQDLDQNRVPQGSLFVELMAVGNRAANDAHVPAELYDRTTGNLRLNQATPGGQPVWRLAISAPHSDDPTEQRTSPFYRSEQMRTAAGTRFPPNSYDPNDLNLLTLSNPFDTSSTAEPVILERFVHFTNTLLPAAGADANHTFFYRSGATEVSPGQYVVVAPRETTYFTMIDDEDEDVAPVLSDTMSVPGQTIDVAKLEVDAAGNFRRYDNFHTAANDYQHPNGVGMAKIIQPRAVVCAMNAPPDGPTVEDPMGTHAWPGPIGLNISEPLRNAYYPFVPTDDPTSAGVTEGYAPGGDDMAQSLPDEPFDEAAGMPLEDVGRETRTTENWRTVYLQRLANPEANFDPVSNPYITVDYAPVDITVYNGDDAHADPWNPPMMGPQEWDPADPSYDGDPDRYSLPTGLSFMSRERGEGRNRTTAGYATYNQPADPITEAHFNLWRHRFVAPTATERTPDTASGMSPNGVDLQVQFRHNLLHTLGYLNVSMGMDSDPALTDYNSPTYPGYQGAVPQDGGGTTRSFPWLDWADRPYATPFEVLRVPHSSQTTWFEDWSRDQATSGAPVDPFDGDPASMNRLANYRGYFKHLWNFFHRPANPRRPGVAAESPQMARLLDYLETPSPFAGSQEFFHVPPGEGGLDVAPGMIRSGHSYLSRFRDPGRININTMPKALWPSLTYAHSGDIPGGGPGSFDADRFADTRRGFPIGPPDNAGLQTWQYPTRIVKPFRSAAKADLAPVLPDRTGYRDDRLRQPDVEATLLRSNQSIYTTTPPSAPFRPLFAGDRHVNDASDQHQHTDKNPFFRYEQMTRLPNLTSTQSNVYAVWMTIGYFEAYRESPAVRNPALAPYYQGQSLPDGIWLGPELGTDTGNNRRHRAFYIIDRSIPVAFEPGNEHNFEKTILLRRYLD